MFFITSYKKIPAQVRKRQDSVDLYLLHKFLSLHVLFTPMLFKANTI